MRYFSSLSAVALLVGLATSSTANDRSSFDRVTKKRLRQSKSDHHSSSINKSYKRDDDRHESARSEGMLRDELDDFWSVYFEKTVSDSLVPPTQKPANAPIKIPTADPPTMSPSAGVPTDDPTSDPTIEPTDGPTSSSINPPSDAPTFKPTVDPFTMELEPTQAPSGAPTFSEPLASATPTGEPTPKPTDDPTLSPTLTPTEDLVPSSSTIIETPTNPSQGATRLPTLRPSSHHSEFPSDYPSDVPTPVTTQNPSFRPTSQPSGGPTYQPSGIPTSTSSLVPSQGGPSLEPSTTPSYIPSLTPSGACFLDTKITCETQDPHNSEEVISCQDLGPLEDLACIAPIKTVQLQLELATCDASLNGQIATGGTTCTDEGSIQLEGRGIVRVLCVDSAVKVLHNDTHSNGETFTLTASDATGLTTCLLLDAKDSDDLLQGVAMDLSGNALGLNNVFGSFQVKGCNDKQCELEVLYTYTIVNEGSESATVNVLARESSVSGYDDLVSFLEVFELGAGQNANVIEDGVVDRCSDEDFSTTIKLEANSSSGVSCPDEFTYQFTTSVACLVNVEIKCQSEDGVECGSLESPSLLCRGDFDQPLTHLRFLYQPVACNDTSILHPVIQQTDIICMDFAMLPMDDAVAISCVADDEQSDTSDSVITVNPHMMVFPGDSVEVQALDGSSLPATVRCVVSDTAGASSIYQEFTLATSNGGSGEKLKLKSRFGSFELQECSMATGDGIDCFETLELTYTIQNIGTNDMNVTVLERTSNGVTTQLIDVLVPDETLSPGQEVQISEKGSFNVCEEQAFTAEVNVEADPTNNLPCFGQDSYRFEVKPPCDVEVQLSCTALDGTDCSEVTGEEFIECQCKNGCTRELVYRYTAASCAADSDGCIDFVNHGGIADIAIKNADRTYFEGRVQIDDDIVLSNEEDCLPDSFRVTIVSPTTAEITQIVSIDASCEVGSVALLDDFGALKFIGYTCSDLVSHNCHVEVEYEVRTHWLGTVGQTLGGWAFELNGMEAPASIALPTLNAIDQAITVIPAEIQRCVNDQYSASASAFAIGGDGAQCSDMDELAFTVVAESQSTNLSPSLTPSAPSLLPTHASNAGTSLSASPVSLLNTSFTAGDNPSLVPTFAPSGSPSASPTVIPSRFPSAIPSDVPSSSPSWTPSNSPSEPPFAIRSDFPSKDPTFEPSATPSRLPTFVPSDQPSSAPTQVLSASPTLPPSTRPTAFPSTAPSDSSSVVPSTGPSEFPSTTPSDQPTPMPSTGPTFDPSASPSLGLSVSPSYIPSNAPSSVPSSTPSDVPSVTPSAVPSGIPSAGPTDLPSSTQSLVPTICELAVRISCVLENGDDCAAIESPPFLCREPSDPPLDKVFFELGTSGCEDRSPTNNQIDSTCESFGDITKDALVNITCQNGSDSDDPELDVTPSVAQPGEVILITTQGKASLPATISCSITDPRNGDLLQQVSFFSSNSDASEGAELNLRDSFGALSLVGCESLNCLQQIEYSYDIINVGTNAVDITRMERTWGDSTDALQDLLSTTNLIPGETALMFETRTVDTCKEGYFVVDVTAGATSPSNTTCSGDGTHEFFVSPPCTVFAQLTCQQLGGSDCADLKGEPLVQCQCPDSCPAALMYRYTGASCKAATSNCHQEGEIGDVAMVEISSGDVTFFSGAVQSTTDILLRSANGECLPSAFIAVVSDIDALVPSQVVTFDAVCEAGGATLLDEYGAFLFAGYTCEDDQIPHNCFVDVEFEVTAFGTGLDTSKVTSSLSFEHSSSTMEDSESEVSFDSDDGLVAVKTNEVNLCVDAQYSTTVNVAASGEANDSRCASETSYVLDVVAGTLFPTQSPSYSPSFAPSVAPSTIPTLLPSVKPSQRPSNLPNNVPSLSPFMSPSWLPSFSPIASPSSIPSGAPTKFPTFVPSPNPSDLSSVAPTLTANNALIKLPTVAPSSANPSQGSRDIASDVPSIMSRPSPSSTPSNAPSTAPTFVPSSVATEQPSAWPSNVASKVLSDVPSSIPSILPSSVQSENSSNSPSDIPIWEPSNFPTAFPTNVPKDIATSITIAPSDVASPVPSTVLRGSPSLAPSDNPSDVSIVSLPSFAPSSGPSSAPSDAPSMAPSLQATELCELDLETTCVPPPGSQSCNATAPPVEQCTGRPFEMIFLFNGGNCDQSFNVQSEGGLFFCTDLSGGPPTERGALSYIVVTDTQGDRIYHSDWVSVGQPFALSDGGEKFEANQLITIYDSEDTDDPSHILQSMQYHSSCSNNLFLKDRFGAIQLIQWVNEDQGVVSCFANQTFDLDVTVPIDIVGGPTTVTGLTVASNVDPFFFNLTDKVAGTVLEGGDTMSTSISIPLDLTHRKTYNLLITVDALTASGKICRATDLQSFTAGDPLPPLFPTFAPTNSPTATDPPTPDPETAQCNLEADIECRTASGQGCRSISAPQARVCESAGDPNSLTFMYTGSNCLAGASTTTNGRCRKKISGLNLTEDNVFISIEGRPGKRKVIVLLDKVVGKGESFVLTSDAGGLGRDITVVISTIDESTGGAGTELQRITRLNSRCRGQEGRDLTLLQDYGAIRLIGFNTNEQGAVSTTETIALTYIIRNEGFLPATLMSAVRQSPFLTEESDQLLIEGSEDVQVGEQLSFTEVASVDLEEAVASNAEYVFSLSITGEGSESGVPCFDRASYFFQID